ncbi:MAG: nuclear transport factor 2 family protein [Dehalococcoidia bacterium]
MTAEENKILIRSAFESWGRGEGNFYSLLADDATWTITGSSPVAGTYTSRQEFLDRAIQPIFERLSEPIRPDVKDLIAEGDLVVALWEGRATALDGVPYDNTYCWVMRVVDGKVTTATAFFDSPALTELFERFEVSATKAP